MRVLVGAVTVIAATLTGCVHYRARTFSPPALEDWFRARSLADTGLVEYLRANQAAATNWPPSELDVRTLALLAYYFSPDLAVARARLTTAEAAVRAAGVRPSPSLALVGGYNRNPESHPTYSILPSFTIEMAGKRGLRILQAQEQMEAARAAFLQTGWVVRSRIRGAAYNYLLAEQRQKLLEAEVAARGEIVGMYEKRRRPARRPSGA